MHSAANKDTQEQIEGILLREIVERVVVMSPNGLAYFVGLDPNKKTATACNACIVVDISDDVETDKMASGYVRES